MSHVKSTSGIPIPGGQVSLAVCRSVVLLQVMQSDLVTRSPTVPVSLRLRMKFLVPLLVWPNLLVASVRATVLSNPLVRGLMFPGKSTRVTST